MRVKVRCCCDPAKLLGWVELPPDKIREGEVVHFTLRDSAPPELASAEEDFAVFGRTAAPERLSLPVAFWQGEIRPTEKAWERDAGLAIKSNDTPMEKLRRIHGFQEAP